MRNTKLFLDKKLLQEPQISLGKEFTDFKVSDSIGFSTWDEYLSQEEQGIYEI